MSFAGYDAWKTREPDWHCHDCARAFLGFCDCAECQDEQDYWEQAEAAWLAAGNLT